MRLVLAQNAEPGYFFDKANKKTCLVQVRKSNYSADSAYICYTSSSDNGISWSEPAIVAPYVICRTCEHSSPTENLRIAVSQSQTPFANRIYVCWSDERHGKNDLDIYLVYSDDKGSSWTEPILVTYHPNHKRQYQPFLQVNQQTGAVNIVYVDQQNYFDGKYCDLYLAQSKNGGLRFDYYKLNTSPLAAKQFSFSAHEESGVLRAAWRNGKTSTSGSLADTCLLRYQKQSQITELMIDRSFTFGENIKVPFELIVPLNITAVITKPLDPAYEKTVVKNKKFAAGKNEFMLNTSQLGLPKGNYVLTLYFNCKNMFVWITE